MSIKDELVALKAKGVLLPEAVVEWARKHPKSALHAAIEWDDSNAAESYRVWQVRRLIAIHVIDDDGERRFVSLSIDRVKGGGYRDVAEVAVDPELGSVMLADALAELKRVRAKYNRVKALSVVWQAVESVEDKHASVDGQRATEVA